MADPTPFKVSDRLLVYVLFTVLSLLTVIVMANNQAVRHIAIEARDASVHSDEQLFSHRLNTQAGHECLLIATLNGVENSVERWLACMNTKTEGVVEPEKN